MKIDKNIYDYCAQYSQPDENILSELIDYTYREKEAPNMISGNMVGNLLCILAKSIAAKKILDVGMFTGYSALSMALATKDDAIITCLDKNEETSKKAKFFFKKAKIDNKINLILAPALETLNKLVDEKQDFDLIFIDADKENYIKYYELAFQLITQKGLILIDNVLWKGEVVDINKNDRMTKIIRDFNSHIKNDKRIEKVILPIGDGVTVCWKL